MNRPADFRGIFRTDPSARAVYSEAAGITQLIPSAVAVPADAGDVQALVRWAEANSIALIPRGSGSSMAGGAVGTGVIIDLSRLNDIGPVDAAAQKIQVGPGALCAAVNAAVAAADLRFPVNPSSANFCTIGGMTATNAAGARTLQCGSMRAWIESLDCVFSDGTRGIISRGGDTPANVPTLGRFLHDVQPVILTGRDVAGYSHAGVRKESSGYGLGPYTRTGDLVDLLVGSEGTLAVFVGITLRLERQPASVSSVLAEFTSLDSAVAAAIKSHSAGASACELLDRTFLEFAGTYSSGCSPECLLLAEVEADDDVRAEKKARALALEFESSGASAVRIGISPMDQGEIWELRHSASPILARLDPRLKSVQLIEDGAVPPEKLGEYVGGLRAAFAKYELRGVIFGHAGDAHVHANPLIDVSSPGWKVKMDSLLEEIVDLTISLGGTLSGEHGDGRLRAPFLEQVWADEAMAIFKMLKECFDPAGILNPGVKFASRTRGLEPIKYDASLSPLPSDARKALDTVAADRTYDAYRLSLIGESQ